MFLHFKLNVIWSISHCVIVDYGILAAVFKNGKFTNRFFKSNLFMAI